jgi:ribosome-binding protein aMBF1 (putative translation factor)
LQIESKLIGAAPQVVSAPEVPGRVIIGHFGVPSTQPLPGATTLREFVAELEADPSMAPRLASARRNLAETLGEASTLRHLRLAAGLSQARLAVLASTTQTYIARVEAGTLDPGTDMLARLASALGTSETAVFSAVRMQRAPKRSKHVG